MKLAHAFAPARHPTLEASRIGPRLWQGSMPRLDEGLRRAGFSMVVLCAMEYQAPGVELEGVELVRAPNDDNGETITQKELRIALAAAKVVHAHLSATPSNRVLVTCMQGRNRSGLVSALTLRSILGITCRERASIVRRARLNALQSRAFDRALAELDELERLHRVYSVS